MLRQPIVILLVLACLLALAGCNNEAKVVVVLDGNPVKVCVEGDCHDIEGDGSKTWIVNWQTSWSYSPESFSATAEDLRQPAVMGFEPLSFELTDGDEYTLNISNP